MLPFVDVVVAAEKKSVNEALRRIRIGVIGIKAEMVKLLALRIKWSGGIADGTYTEADLATLDAALTPWTTAPETPNTLAQTVEAFLDSGLGE